MTTSLNSSKQLLRNADSNVVELKDSLVDSYANRESFLSIDPFLMNMNFLQFASKYKMYGKKLKERSSPDTLALRILQKYSSSPQNSNYFLHCKIQLLRYKILQHNYVS